MTPMIHVTVKPDPVYWRGDVRPCARCGRERRVRTGPKRTGSPYCADCRPYAVADGWVAG